MAKLSPVATMMFTASAMSRISLLSKFGMKCKPVSFTLKPEIKAILKVNVAFASTASFAEDAEPQPCFILETFWAQTQDAPTSLKP